IGLGGIRALASRVVANARRVALIAGLTHDALAKVFTLADALDADVADRVRIAVVAGGAIGYRRIRAGAGRGIAGARRVARIAGAADHWIAANARAVLAGVGLGTGIAVVAGCAIRGRRVGALASLR